MKIFKYILCNIFALILLSNIVYAGEAPQRIKIPTFDITVNGTKIDTTKMQYPLITYNDITYFPLTWKWCAEMGLVVGYTVEDGLYIVNYDQLESNQVDLNKIDAGGYQKAGSTYNATLPTYPIFVNGIQIKNNLEKYPLLNFRGITYFPLTWRFVIDEFGWDLSWDGKTGLNIKSDGQSNVSSTLSFDTLDNLSYQNGGLLGTDINEGILINGSKLMLDDSLLLDLTNAIPVGDTPEYLNANRYQVNGMNVITMSIYFMRNGESIPAPYTPHNYYVLIDYGSGKYKLLAEWPTTQEPSNVFPSGSDGLYMSSDYNNFPGFRYSSSLGFVAKVKSNESVSILNDQWEDWNSVHALGTDTSGNLYLMNTWFPDENTYFGSGSVSPIRDGYFKLSKEGSLSKLFPFVQANDTLVMPSGDVYLAISRKNSIFHIQSKTWINP